MRAVVYLKPFDVAVQEVPDPRIEHPADAIVRITSSCICGSDLHMYEGRTAAEPGIVFGHENLGLVEEAGSGVIGLEPGDRVVMPFNVACGFCKNCQAGYTGYCLTVNPSGFAGGAYGYVAMGPYPGGQAEYLRVPYADFNCLPLPAGTEHEADYALLADIFPTGYHGCELAGVAPGETVAVYGAGPVGLMAAYSAFLRGASRVFVVDRVPERLAKASEIGAVPVDFSQGDPVQQIKDETGGEGTDKGVDAVGYQAAARTGDREEPAARCPRRARPVRAVRPGRGQRAGPARAAAGGHRPAVREGTAGRHRPGQRQALQPPAARPDHRGPGHAQLRGLPRAPARAGPGRVPEVRPASGGLHQGHSQTGPMKASTATSGEVTSGDRRR